MSEDKALPRGWIESAIHSVAIVNPRTDTTILADDDLISFVPMALVGEATGHIDTSTFRRFIEVKKGYTVFQENDVIFAKITPCMENGKAAVARNLSCGIGIGSTEFHVLRSEI